MPDLLTHALVAYTIAILLSWRYRWIGRPYVTVCMAGAFVPDLAKIGLVVPAWRVSRALAVPFSWSGIHTAGGALVVVGIGAVVFVNRRREAALMLGIGALSHLIADAFLLTVTGRSYPILWPLSGYSPPTPGLYLSTEPWPTMAAVLIAIIVLTTDRARSQCDADATRG